MSYCRFSDADAYIFLSTDGLNCCGCSLAPRTKLETPYIDILGISHDYEYEYKIYDTAQDMLDHIQEHRANGDYIPFDVDLSLKADFPDLNASTAETEEERKKREELLLPSRERVRQKLKDTQNTNE